MVELQVVGGGRMGEALVGGLLQAGDLRHAEVRIVEALPMNASNKVLKTELRRLASAPDA